MQLLKKNQLWPVTPFFSFYLKVHLPSDRMKNLILKDKRICIKVKIYEFVLYQKKKTFTA